MFGIKEDRIKKIEIEILFRQCCKIFARGYLWAIRET